MSALSIRKLPKDLEVALAKEAKAAGETKTEIVIKILNKEFGLDDKNKRKESLKKFFGKMTKAEYTEFKKSTSVFEKIDEDLWK